MLEIDIKFHDTHYAYTELSNKIFFVHVGSVLCRCEHQYTVNAFIIVHFAIIILLQNECALQCWKHEKYIYYEIASRNKTKLFSARIERRLHCEKMKGFRDSLQIEWQ